MSNWNTKDNVNDGKDHYNECDDIDDYYNGNNNNRSNYYNAKFNSFTISFFK